MPVMSKRSGIRPTTYWIGWLHAELGKHAARRRKQIRQRDLAAKQDRERDIAAPPRIERLDRRG